MTIDGFFRVLPRDGWMLDEVGQIRFGDGTPWPSCCPHLYLVQRMNIDEDITGGWGRVWHSADNFKNGAYFDPALRARLLAHCGLTEAK